MAVSQSPQLELPQPQALCGLKHTAPLLLSTAEMAGERRGSTPESQAALAKVVPWPARGEPARYLSILVDHCATKVALSLLQLT